MADTDHERALVARADEEPGMVPVNGDEREMPFQLVEGEPCRLDEVAVVALLDQVADGFGIGLGREDVPCGAQALAQVPVVLDDPVEHDRELCGILDSKRVRVLGCDAAVRGPTRVAEASRRR